MNLSNPKRIAGAARAVLLLVCVLGLLPGPAALAATAGRFLFVAGDVRVLPAQGGNAVRVRRGAEVQPGDTVITTARGVAQLRMVDGAQLAVRPATQLRIDEYRFDEPEQEDKSFFSLLTGAFRSVTGLIGQRNQDAYQVSTSTATIGIRGSDADIGHDQATALTAVRTYEGAHVLTSRDQVGAASSLVTGPGDVAVALPGQAPRFAAEFPFQASPTPGGGGEAATEDEQGEAQQTSGEGGEAGGEGRRPPPRRRAARRDQSGAGLGPRPLPVTTIVSTAGASTLDVVRVAPTGSVVVGGDLARNAVGTLKAQAGGLIVNPPQSIALLGPSNAVVLVADSSADGNFTFLAGAARLTTSGSFAIPGGAGRVAAKGTWGLWQGPFVVVDAGRRLDTVGGFPFAIADPATTVSQMVALGGTSFTYNRIGGAITNEQGAGATSYMLTASGTFSGGPSLGGISINGAANFPAGAGSTGWTMTGTGTIRDLINDRVTLSGTCTGCTAPSGEVGGRFVGTRAEGLLLGVGLADATGKGIIGSAVLAR